MEMGQTAFCEILRVLRKSAPPESDLRAENGGLDPSWLDLAFCGVPRFSVQRSQNLLKCRRGALSRNRYFGTSRLKIGVPRKRQIQPRRIQPLIPGPLTECCNF